MSNGGWIGAVALVLILFPAGLVAAYWARRFYLRSRDDEMVGFTLQDLREMKERGQISDVEYRATRDAIIASMGRSGNRADESGEGEEASIRRR